MLPIALDHGILRTPPEHRLLRIRGPRTPIIAPPIVLFCLAGIGIALHPASGRISFKKG